MAHAFRIGPFGELDEPCSLYVASMSSGELHATQAADDVEGLRMLIEQLEGEPLVVEPSLGKAGKRLRLRRVRLPPELAHRKATMAFALVLNLHELTGPAVEPAMMEDLLDAAAGFTRAAPWRFVDGDTPLRVEVSDGKRKRTLDGALMGQGGQEFGFVLYPKPGVLRRLLAAGDPEKLAARTEIMAVSLEPEPKWVVAALEQGVGLSMVPVPMHLRGERPIALLPGDLAVLAAVLRAAAEIGPETHEARGKSGVEPHAEVIVHVPEPAIPRIVYELPEPPSKAGPKVSRNAPCPCGSGRKYKRCCLAKDEAAARARAPRPVPRARGGLDPEVRLVFEIIAFIDARLPAWRASPSRGWQALEQDPAAEQLLMPLLAYQRHIVAGMTPASLWWSEHAEQADAETREIVEAERRAPLSVWEVLEVRPEEGLDLVNLLTGERYFVHETKGTRGVRVRDAMLARVVTRRGRSVLGGLHPRVLPPAEAHEVVMAARAQLKLAVAPIAPERLDHPFTIDLLLEQWHARHARLVETKPVERELQNTDGEPFEPHEDHFALARGSTREGVVAVVLELRGAHLDEDGRRETVITFTKPGNAMHAHWRRTVLGTVRVDARTLVLEANSAARIDELRGRLERALGPSIEHRERKHEPVKTVLGPAAKGPLALDATTSWGLFTPPPEAMLREEVRHFLERPHDQLGGLSPRQAMSKAPSRRALHQLLKEYEHAESGPGVSGFGGGMGFVARVREALDLSPTGEVVRIDSQTRRTGRGQKVSETLLEFAAPLLEEITDGAQLRPALELAAMVWNAHRLEHGPGGPAQDPSEELAALVIRAGLEPAAQWPELLRARCRLFADDERIIELLDVRWKGGEIFVKAAARLAFRPQPRTKGKGQLGLFE